MVLRFHWLRLQERKVTASMQVVEKTRSLLSAHLALFGKRAILKVTAFLVEGAVSAQNVITLSWQGWAGPVRASALRQQAP